MFNTGIIPTNLKMMTNKTKQTLTILGVGVVAFMGVRYLMNRTKDGSEEKSNVVGRMSSLGRKRRMINCTCADGGTYNSSVPCEVGCSRLGGVETKARYSRASGRAQAQVRTFECVNSDATFATDMAAPYGSGSPYRDFFNSCGGNVIESTTGNSVNSNGGTSTGSVNLRRAKQSYSRADGAPCGCGA